MHERSRQSGFFSTNAMTSAVMAASCRSSGCAAWARSSFRTAARCMRVGRPSTRLEPFGLRLRAGGSVDLCEHVGDRCGHTKQVEVRRLEEFFLQHAIEQLQQGVVKAILI